MLEIAAPAPARVTRTRLLRQPVAVSGFVVLALLILTALLAPQLAPYPPKLGGADALAAPSSAHWMGTDDLGRDVLSNVMYGARTALITGFVAATFSLVIGSVVGLTAGYAGGIVDDLLMRIAEVVQLLPRLLLAILLITIFGSSTLTIVAILGATFWPLPARLLRAQVLSARNRDYVMAARSLGAGTPRILLRHILPNVASPLIVMGATQVATAVLTEASLSFLGVGDPSLISWGHMLQEAQRFFRTAWWLFVFPGLALGMLVLSVTLVADGINDTLRRR